MQDKDFGNAQSEISMKIFPTLDLYCKFLADDCPSIWNYYNVKQIDAPSTHYGFRFPAAMFTTAASSIIHGGVERSAAANNLLCASSVAGKYGYPTYYVSKNLLESVLHTHPPKNMLWQEMPFPFDGMIFMLPKGYIKNAEGHEVNALGVTRYRIEQSYSVRLPGYPVSNFTNADTDRVSVYWGMCNGAIIEDASFPISQSLEVPGEWLAQANERNIANPRYSDSDFNADTNFGQYMTALAANLLLVMAARPDYIERGDKPIRKLKNGLTFYTPNFIGSKYVTEHRANEAGTKKIRTGTPEIRWRCGHHKIQHYGTGNKLVKVIRVEPYTWEYYKSDDQGQGEN